MPDNRCVTCQESPCACQEAQGLSREPKKESELSAYCRNASKIIESWPRWKQDVLRPPTAELIGEDSE